MASLRTQIATSLLTRLDTVTALKYKSFDEVKLVASDFSEWEIPAVQLIDLGEDVVHEHRRSRNTWQIAVEVILGDTQTATATQSLLWDLMETIELALFEKPKLDIDQVINLRLLGSATDLHLLKPMYSGRIVISVEYYQALLGPC